MAPSLACIEELKKISSFDACIYIRLKEKARSADWLQALPGAGVHKGFNKHTGTYNHISKNAHFSLILFCGTMYLQRRILHYES